MRLLLIPLLLIFSMPTLAAHITCYSAGKVIYKGYSKEVYYDDRILVLHDKRTKKDVFIFAECVVKI